jgi:NADH-quinone oxidoreductase subunit N
MFAEVTPTLTTPQLNHALAQAVWLLQPEMVLGLFACLVFIGGTFTGSRRIWGIVSLVGFLLALWTSLDPKHALVGPSDQEIFGVPILIDALANFTRITAILAGILLLLLAWDEMPDRQAADHHACLLILTAGLSMIGSANDLVTLFLALELVSIPTYIMLYLPRHDDAAQEAALKYFLLSIFSSAILLFGFSYLYGLVGSTNLSVILNTLLAKPAESPVLAAIALVTVVCGLGFRLTAVPFHFYAPDVYQGTANTSAALLASVPKIAGVVALLRVLGYVVPEAALPAGWAAGTRTIGMALSDQVPLLFWILAVITMFLGNLLALRQEHVRRILAYSSIAHAGYMLVALSAAPYLRRTPGSPDGVEAVLYYLIAYGVMTVGAFGILAYLDGDGRRIDTLDDLAGVSREHPTVAIIFAIFLFSLIGIPLTAGFTGKFLILFGALALSDPQANLFRVLAVLMVINAAIGGWYYLRIIATVYLRTPIKTYPVRRSLPLVTMIAICAILTVGLSVPPGLTWLSRVVKTAAQHTPQPPLVAER